MFCTYCGAENPDEGALCAACGRKLTRSGASRGARDALDAALTEPGLAPGTFILNRYRVEKLLGMGGMGRVYLAKDEALSGRPVALKTLHGLLAHDPGAVARLKEEALAAMDLTHPAIVRVNHYEDGEPLKFLVMEYVEGETLAHRLAREKRLAEAEVRRIGVALCDALAHAHAHRVLHRDVKPANVLLGAGGAVKLADFGIARVARDSLSRLTGRVDSGTLLYMAPEAVRGESADARSDLYSLGVVLYEMAAGAPPFHTGDLTYQILQRPPAPLEGVSAELSAVVQALLAKRPDERFPSATDVRAELDGTAAARRRADERARVEEERGRAAEERARRDAQARAREEERRRAAQAGEREKAEDRQREEQRRRWEVEERRRRAEDERRQREAEARRPMEEAPAAREVEARRREEEGSRHGVSRRWIPIAGAGVLALVVILAVLLGGTPRQGPPAPEPEAQPRAEAVSAPPPEAAKTEPVRESPAGPGVKASAPPAPVPTGERPSSRAAAPAGSPVGERWTSPLDGRVMVWIPPGEFLMGSPASEPGRFDDETQHRVVIAEGFWLDATEVTNAAYQRFVQANPEWHKGRIQPRYHDGTYLQDWNGTQPLAGKGEHPAVWVSWYAARAYCRWAGKRLPTEAEWEYAARAGKTTAYWWGDTFDGSRAYNVGGGPVAVGSAARTNPWGLSDMLGNVWEWTSTLSRGYPYRLDDGREDPNSADSRVLRGGDFYSAPRSVRSAGRNRNDPRSTIPNYGFRCAL